MRKSAREHTPFPILVQHKDATADLALTSSWAERGTTQQCANSNCQHCN